MVKDSKSLDSKVSPHKPPSNAMKQKTLENYLQSPNKTEKNSKEDLQTTENILNANNSKKETKKDLNNINDHGKKDVKEKSRRKKKTPVKENTQLTDFYPVRRSKRQPLSKIKDLEYQDLEKKISSKCCDGLEIRLIEGKGRGVFATKTFARKDFIVEYSGTLISYDEAKKREKEYGKEPEKYGCYMYYFSFRNKKYCIDATCEDGSFGRLLNHSVHGNVESKLVNISNKPVLILVAKTDIDPDTELSYDYGERSKDIIESHPWLQL